MCIRDSKRDVLPFDRLLVDVGRQANVSGLGLEELGIETTDEGALEVNELLQSRYTNIWACGEVCGPYPLAHVGAFQARHATINALFGEFRTFARVLAHQRRPQDPIPAGHGEYLDEARRGVLGQCPIALGHGVAGHFIIDALGPVSYTHLTLPTIYSV